MVYRVVFFRDDEQLADVTWARSLAEAQLMAKDSILSGLYDRIEVLNEKGHVCLRHRENLALS